MKETEELLQLGLAREEVKHARISVKCGLTPVCSHHMPAPTNQEAFIKQVNPSDELARTRVIPFEQGVPFHLRPHTVHSHVPVKGNQHNHEEQPRRVTTAGEVFEDIDRAQTAHQRTRPIIRPPQLSLWDDDSSVDVADHYRTMTDGMKIIVARGLVLCAHSTCLAIRIFLSAELLADHNVHKRDTE